MCVDPSELKILFPALMLQRGCLQSVSSGRDLTVFTEQLIPTSSENLFHLVSGLHSVQMLKEVHLKQFSLHFLHMFASVGNRGGGAGESSSAHTQKSISHTQLLSHQVSIQ